MSDAEYITDGPLIDLATPDWREDLLPFEHILVKPNSLPDSEPQLSDSQRSSSNPSVDLFGNVRWTELDLDGLLSPLNPPLPTGNWSKLISQAEKLVGGPAPFINLGSFLNSEAGFLTARARRLASTVDHPLFATVRACLRGKPINPLFALSKYTDNSSSVRNQRPSGGLIILLTGQSEVSTTAASTKLCNKHRSVAELFETIHVAMAIHKSLVDLANSDPEQFAACQPNIDYESWTKDMETGNKLATLAGDVLLASASTTLASYHNAQIVDIVSEAISNMIEAEFSPVSLSRPAQNSQTHEQAFNDQFQFDSTTELSKSAQKWLNHVSLSRGSILGSCCQSAFLMSESYFRERNACNSSHNSEESKFLAPVVKQFGLDWACLIRLIDEREHIQRTGLGTNNVESSQTQTNHSLYCFNMNHSGYTESGLPEPTLADILLSDPMKPTWENGDLRIMTEYNKIGNVLVQRLSNSFSLISSTTRAETNYLPATLLLGQMVEQLVGEATCICE